MPDKIQINEELGFIEVHSSGVVTKDDIAGSIEKVQYILESKNISNILVDTTDQNEIPNLVGIYQLFSNLPGKFKLALLVRESGVTEEDLKFGVTVAKNRGTLIRMFFEREKAIAWLNSLSNQA